MTRTIRITSLSAIAAAAFTVAGCGGAADTADAGATSARQASAAPAQVACPERTSGTWRFVVRNQTGVRLRLTTDPTTIDCDAWSATGNPSNINADGGRELPTGREFEWRLERAFWNKSVRPTWVTSIEDIPLEKHAGDIGLIFRKFSVGEGVVFPQVRIEDPLGSDEWTCGVPTPVVVGTLRGRDLIAKVNQGWCLPIRDERVLSLYTR